MIPPSLCDDLSDPRVSAQGPEPLRGELTPGSADGIDDGDVSLVHPVRQMSLTQIEPDPLDRVELRRVGRQAEQRHIGRHHEVVAGVPPGAVEGHDDVLVFGQRRREAPQELVHDRGGDGGQYQTEVAAGRGFDRGEDIGKGVALIDRTGRALAAQPPATTAPALLADPGFILEIQRDPLVRVCLRRAGEGGGQLLF